MPGPAFGDDDWDELARELNVQKAPPADQQSHTPNLHPDTDDAPAPAADVGFPEDDPDTFAGEEAAADEAGEFEGEGEQPAGEGQEEQPGTGRKRRRRRRRRKKGGGAEAPAGEAGEAAPAAEEAEEPVASYRGSVRVTAPRPEPEEGGFEDEAAEVAEESGGVSLAAEEDAGGEMLRDLIANWNVPSWDDIVTGLYRPER